MKWTEEWEEEGGGEGDREIDREIDRDGKRWRTIGWIRNRGGIGINEGGGPVEVAVFLGEGRG